MGCDGNTPNVICPSRISPIVRPWLAALPTPTSGGPLNNYLGPAIPDTILGNSDYYMGRFDAAGQEQRSRLHERLAPARARQVRVRAAAVHRQRVATPIRRTRGSAGSTGTALQHHAAEPHVHGVPEPQRGLRLGEPGASSIDFPKIAGVAGHNVPPQMSFSDGFAQFGTNAGINIGNVTTRPTFIINDSLTWTKGAHTLKGGMEYRKIMGNIHGNGNQAGSFTFGRGSTGLVGVNSGSPIASFLLGAVDNASSTFRAVDSAYPRQNAWILLGGDTWRANDKLTLDYGLRWDYYSPSREKYDRFSFFDPIGANPGAGGPARATRVCRRQLWRGQLRRALSREGFLRRLCSAVRRRLPAQRQDGPPQRVGHLLHAGVLSGLGRRHLAGRVLDTPVVQHQPRRHPAGVLPRAGPARRTSSGRRSSSPTTGTARASAVPPARRQQAPVLAPVEHHRGPRARHAISR